ncbi:MAG: hypothetical protein HC860_03660 [Alkalinema sp. RU_4_3]|nr:hypothetical protein [Alkalinema sp. RU_4_3]
MSYGLTVYAPRDRDLQSFFESQADRIYHLDQDHSAVVDFLDEFEAACDRWSVTSLNNHLFSPCPFDWMEQVDQALSKLGIPQLQLADLVFQSPPLALPSAPIFPLVGYWRSEDIYEAYLKLANTHLMERSPPPRSPNHHPRLARRSLHLG